MTKDEFLNKWHLTGENEQVANLAMLIVLDDLYCQFTKEQAIELVSTYYDNADDIFNSLNDALQEAAERLQDLLDETPKA